MTTTPGQQVTVTASPDDLHALVGRIAAVRSGRRRVVIGIAGPPGAGKSSLADALNRALAADGVPSLVFGMDGFHLAQAELVRLGRHTRKGALDTFDAEGYVALLRRLRAQHPDDGPVYAPRYDRTVGESIGSAIRISPTTPVLLTEGNYLLIDDAPWRDVRDLLDETWYLIPDDADRRARLLARHIAHGKAPDHAAAFTDSSDQRNAELVETTAARADVLVRWLSAP